MISLTQKAIDKIKDLVDCQEAVLGIRVNVKTAGCSGLIYEFEYLNEIKDLDEIIKIDDIIVAIDPKAVMFLFGSEMDYQKDKFKSGFVFHNPNEKGRCGCGLSFRT